MAKASAGKRDVRILAGHDGSCPNSMKGVTRKGDTEWVVYPMWRRAKGESEEAPGNGFRFNVRAVNADERPHRVTVHADWGKESLERIRLRDIGHVRHEDSTDWHMVSPQVRCHVVTYRLVLEPGTTEIGLWPAYNTATCASFVAKAANHPLVSASVAGRSERGRDIHLIEIAAPGRASAREQVVIQARDHAYETAGNYCVEGMAAFLLSDDGCGS